MCDDYSHVYRVHSDKWQGTNFYTTNKYLEQRGAAGAETKFA